MQRTPTLNKHIFFLVFKPTIVVALGLLTLVWLMQSLRFLDLMINKGLTLGTFFHLTMLLVPFLLTIIVPIAVLAGAIYAFKVMNDENELPAIFSAGLPRGRIVQPALWVGMLAVLFSYANAFYFTPAGMSAFKKLQHELRHSEGHLLLEEGTFNPIGDDIMVYLKKRIGRTGLEMLLVHDTSDKEKPVTWMAKHGEITFTEDNRPRLTLEQGIRQEVTPTQTNMLAFEEHTLDIQQQISQPPKRVKNAEERFMSELKPTNGERISDKMMRQFEAEKMKRIVWPLTPLVVILITSIFLIRPRATRRGVVKPTVFASLFGISYIMALIGIASIAEDGNPYILYGQLSLPFVMMFIALFYLKDQKV